MEANVLDKIREEIARKGYTLGTRQATQWLLGKVSDLRVSRSSLMADETRARTNEFMGGMFFFYYSPKGYETLPYYDRFPLVIPFQPYSDGFLGLNLHYLGPRQRATLLLKLTEYVNNTRYNESTRFRLTYDLLKGATKVPEFKPCLKRYLASHIQSRFLNIPADEWHIAALLPVEQFAKASKASVWRDSRNKV